MSEKPRDDKEFEEFLAGRDPLSRSYREAAAEQPSADLDAAILAAARRAAGAGPQAAGSKTQRVRRSWISQWSAPLAAAAVIVLAVALTVVLERDPEVMDFGEASRQRPVASAPAPVLERAPAASKSPAPAESPAPEKSLLAKRSGEARKAVPPAAVPEPFRRDARLSEIRDKQTDLPDDAPGQRMQMPSVESDTTSGVAADSAVAPSAERKTLAKSKQEANAVAAPSAMRREALEEVAVAPTMGAQARLSAIEALYARGHDDEADRALAVFCRDFPDHKLPDRLSQQARRMALNCAG